MVMLLLCLQNSFLQAAQIKKLRDHVFLLIKEVLKINLNTLFYREILPYAETITFNFNGVTFKRFAAARTRCSG